MCITKKVSTRTYIYNDNERCRLLACVYASSSSSTFFSNSTSSKIDRAQTPLHRKNKKTEKTHMMMQRSIRQVLNRTVRNRRMMTSWVEDMNKGLTEVDPEICDIIEKEKHRQRSSLCLIGTRRHRPFLKNSLQH